LPYGSGTFIDTPRQTGNDTKSRPTASCAWLRPSASPRNVQSRDQQVTGKELSGPAADAYLAFFTAGFPAKGMALLPKGTPEDVLQAYEEAVRQMKQDPEYQEKKEAALGTYEQVTGKAAEALKRRATEVPDEARQYVIDLLTKEYNVDLAQ
jgi:hypothetical protein